MPVSGNRPIVLARYLALAWCALIVYASLHPFSGWRSTGVSPWGFLTAAWPRYWTGFDLVANVAVYLPLGFFFMSGAAFLTRTDHRICAGDLVWRTPQSVPGNAAELVAQSRSVQS